MSTHDAHRAILAGHLRDAYSALAAMLMHWEDNDLPGDFLSGDAYPFTRSLDEVVADIAAAVDTLER